MSNKLLQIDQFGLHYIMRLDSKKLTVQTFMGSICSLITIIVVSYYAYLQTAMLFDRKDDLIVSSTQVDFFDSDFTFDASMGLNFAVAFTAYDSETEDILDPSYGSLTFSAYGWGNPDI